MHNQSRSRCRDLYCRSHPAETGPYVLQAITIDFHDTLFQCDDWFDLEVRDLPTRFLHWLASNQANTPYDAETWHVEPIYRSLRLGAIESGIEIDSISCVDQVCHAIDLNVDRATISRGVDELMRAALTTAEPRPGVLDTIQTLRGAGLKLGIISNAIHHEFLEWSLNRFEISEYFDLVLSSASAGFYKSRVELYQRAIADLSVPAHTILHVGDSYRFDVVGAAAAGMRTAWLNLTGASPAEVTPDLIVHTMEGLGTRLLEWNASSRPANQGSRDAH